MANPYYTLKLGTYTFGITAEVRGWNQTTKVSIVECPLSEGGIDTGDGEWAVMPVSVTVPLWTDSIQAMRAAIDALITLVIAQLGNDLEVWDVEAVPVLCFSWQVDVLQDFGVVFAPRSRFKSAKVTLNFLAYDKPYESHIGSMP